MRFLIHGFVFFIMVVGLSGCVTLPTETEIREANYGPSPTDFEKTVKDFMSTQLKDPSSAVYEFNGFPTKMWAKDIIGPPMYGWGICAWINAKNSFGGYTGRKKNFFLIKDDRIIRFRNDLGAENSCQVM